MNSILNLTQHNTSPAQKKAGVCNLSPAAQTTVKKLLTFDKLPTPKQITDRATQIATIALLHLPTVDRVMIGGAPFLMAELERQLLKQAIQPLYAFSLRISEDIVLPDGKVHKTSVFVHRGFVTPPLA